MFIGSVHTIDQARHSSAGLSAKSTPYAQTTPENALYLWPEYATPLSLERGIHSVEDEKSNRFEGL